MWIENNNLAPIGSNKIEESKLINERDSWKGKYFTLLEKYNKILEENRK